MMKFPLTNSVFKSIKKHLLDLQWFPFPTHLLSRVYYKFSNVSWQCFFLGHGVPICQLIIEVQIILTPVAMVNFVLGWLPVPEYFKLITLHSIVVPSSYFFQNISNICFSFFFLFFSFDLNFWLVSLLSVSLFLFILNLIKLEVVLK